MLLLCLLLLLLLNGVVVGARLKDHGGMEHLVEGIFGEMEMDKNTVVQTNQPSIYPTILQTSPTMFPTYRSTSKPSTKYPTRKPTRIIQSIIAPTKAPFSNNVLTFNVLHVFAGVNDIFFQSESKYNTNIELMDSTIKQYCQNSFGATVIMNFNQHIFIYNSSLHSHILTINYTITIVDVQSTSGAYEKMKQRLLVAPTSFDLMLHNLTRNDSSGVFSSAHTLSIAINGFTTEAKPIKVSTLAPYSPSASSSSSNRSAVIIEVVVSIIGVATFLLVVLLCCLYSEDATALFQVCCAKEKTAEQSGGEMLTTSNISPTRDVVERARQAAERVITAEDTVVIDHFNPSAPPHFLMDNVRGTEIPEALEVVEDLEYAAIATTATIVEGSSALPMASVWMGGSEGTFAFRIMDA
jgi:hypothetical protein